MAHAERRAIEMDKYNTIKYADPHLRTVSPGSFAS